ncbi:hypothetical protein PINS_up007566 [Pythium insidiosum]|nr:hypothetical protein PINS_up007566 [Pythium insidiosum]
MPTPSSAPTPSLRPSDDEVKEASVRERGGPSSSSPSTSQAETAAIRRDSSTADNPLTLILIVGSVVCVVLAASLFILVKTGRREQKSKHDAPDHRPSPEISTRMAPYGVPPEFAAQLSPPPPALPIRVVPASTQAIHEQPPQHQYYDHEPLPVQPTRAPKKPQLQLQLDRPSDALGGSFIDYNDPTFDVLTPRSDIVTADPRASQMSDWFETRHTGVRRRSLSRPERDTITDFDRSTTGMLEASIRMTSPSTASVHEVTFHARGSGENDVFGDDDDDVDDDQDNRSTANNAWAAAAKRHGRAEVAAVEEDDRDRISDLHDHDTDTDIDDDRMSELHDYEAERASSRFFSSGSDWMMDDDYDDDADRFSSEYAVSRPRATSSSSALRAYFDADGDDFAASDRRMGNMSGFSDLHDDDADYDDDEDEDEYAQGFGAHESRDDSYVMTRSTDASVMDIDIDEDGDDDHGDSF